MCYLNINNFMTEKDEDVRLQIGRISSYEMSSISNLIELNASFFFFFLFFKVKIITKAKLSLLIVNY